MLKLLSGLVLAATVLWLPAVTLAQLPGEPRKPDPYDPVGEGKYNQQLYAPDERVREAQRVLREKGHYNGPLDGVLSPATRAAVWNFQKAQGFRLSGRLEPETMSALGLGAAPPSATGSGPPEIPPSAAPRPGGVVPEGWPPRGTQQAP